MKIEKKISKLHVKKNDSVIVLTGNDKGKQGKILRVFPAESRVIVEGVNMQSKHQRPTQKNPQGVILKREQAIHVSNVKKA